MALSRGFSPLRSSTPATFGAIGLIAVAFLLSWVPSTGAWMAANLALAVPQMSAWQLITYPLFIGNAGGILLCLFFAAWWLLMIGQSLESGIGSRAMTFLLLLATVVGGVFFWIGAAVAQTPGILFGPFLAISYLTVVWASRNPDQTIMLMMIIPIKAKYLALLTTALVLFGYGAGAPLLGIFVALPMAAAWFWGATRLSALAGMPSLNADAKRKQRDEREFRGYIDDVRKREQEREERERLRKLFEDSVSDSDRD